MSRNASIIAGSRGITDPNVVLAAVAFAVSEGIVPSVVISGGARGVDTLGEQWAKSAGIPVEVYPAEWGKYGKKAGTMRNVRMGNIAIALIAVWDGKSPGTKHMIDFARRNNLKVYVHATA